MNPGRREVQPEPAHPSKRNGKREPLQEMILACRKGATPPAAEAVLECIVGRSPAIQEVKGAIQVAAPQELPTLITGETGTGKELVSRALHLLSPRYNQPFEAVNCAAIPADLAESILFGHLRGAFTGAVRDQRGVFEMASGGTLFLDEIGDLPLHTQVKILRALEEGYIQRIGSREQIPVDLYVVAATNKDLDAMVQGHAFRADLLHRLVGFRIHVPSLAERNGDVGLLAEWFLGNYNHRKETNIGMEADVSDFLKQLHFPGNVRQLCRLIECAAALAVHERCAISIGIIERSVERVGGNIRLQPETEGPVEPGAAALAPGQGFSLERSVGDVEADLVQKALMLAKANVTEAARILGISRRTLYKLMKKHDQRIQAALDTNASTALSSAAQAGRRRSADALILSRIERIEQKITQLEGLLAEANRKAEAAEQIKARVEEAARRVDGAGQAGAHVVTDARAAAERAVETKLAAGMVPLQRLQERLEGALARMEKSEAQVRIERTGIEQAAEPIAPRLIPAVVPTGGNGVPSAVASWTYEDLVREIEALDPFAIDLRSGTAAAYALADKHRVPASELSTRIKELEIDAKWILMRKRRTVLSHALRTSRTISDAARKLGVTPLAFRQYANAARIGMEILGEDARPEPYAEKLI